MQQRQLRLGDILDDYCPRERRVTNHVVVAMIGADVKQTRCTTCDSEHEYKHAKVPRQRRKADTPAALYAQVAASRPRVAHEGANAAASPDDNTLAAGALGSEPMDDLSDTAPTLKTVISDNGANNGDGAEYASADAPRDEGAVMDGEPEGRSADEEGREADNDGRAEDMEGRGADMEGRGADMEGRGADTEGRGADTEGREADTEEGPVHRPLIRASLPRPEGQQPPARPIPEFTIRQPGGRPGRFRPRHQRGGGQQGQHFGGNRGNGNFAGGPPRGMRPGGGGPRTGGRHHGGPNRKRSK